MEKSSLKFVAENTHRLKADDQIIGFYLYDLDKEVISKIDGLVVEAENFLPRYVVLTLGGFMMIRGKTVLLPTGFCERVDLGNVKTVYTLEQLMGIPAPLDIEKIMPDEEELILSHYGMEPYWKSRNENEPDG